MEHENNEMNLDLQEADGHENKFLTFSLGKEEYAVHISYVTEIIGIQHITDLPDMPNYVKGVINLRGKVIPVIDVRLRFSFDERDYDERTCIIVVNMNNTSVGLIVDSVREVLDIPENQIDPPPGVRKGSESRFIAGLGKVADEVKIILELNKILYEEDMERLAETA